MISCLTVSKHASFGTPMQLWPALPCLNMWVKILGYSETQAAERVNSVRLMRAIPEVEAKIKTGSLSMTTASLVQRHLKQEKRAGEYSDDCGHRFRSIADRFRSEATQAVTFSQTVRHQSSRTSPFSENRSI